VKYTALLKDVEKEITIKPLDDHRFEVTIDDVTRTVDARSCEVDSISLLIDNRSYDLSFSFEDDRVELNFWNQYFDVEILDERKMRMRRVRSEMEMSGPEIIASSMPGKVVKVLVEPGKAVEGGDGIIIIEAMKMENEIRCKKPGVVKTVNVGPGDTVETNAVLAEIEPE